MYAGWPSVERAAISNDGKYALYYIRDQPPGSSTLVLQATDRSWKKTYSGARQAAFTPDSRTAAFITPGDSLCLLNFA